MVVALVQCDIINWYPPQTGVLPTVVIVVIQLHTIGTLGALMGIPVALVLSGRRCVLASAALGACGLILLLILMPTIGGVINVLSEVIDGLCNLLEVDRHPVTSFTLLCIFQEHTIAASKKIKTEQEERRKPQES